MAICFARGRRVASGAMADSCAGDLDAVEAHKWDFEKGEKVNLETGEAITVPEEILDETEHRLGL